MAMHYRQRFDASPVSLAVMDLRNVFRRAVGYALVSAIGVSGCGEMTDGAGETVQMPNAAAQTPSAAGAAAPTPNTATPTQHQSAGTAAPIPSSNPPPTAAATGRPTPVMLTCNEPGLPLLFEGLTPANPFDAAEYRVQAMSLGEPQIWFTHGLLCSSAANKTACEADIARAADEPNLIWSEPRPMFGRVAEYVLTTRGDEVRKYQSRAELLQFLGPIDSPEDALLLLYYDRYVVGCREPLPNTSFIGVVPSSIRERNDGYEILYLTQIFNCGDNSIERVKLLVATDGKVSELTRDKWSESKGCEGRRPEGLSSNHRSQSTSALGEHFARMAHLEHASVAAFDVLAQELQAHGAPEELIAWARRSASDEVKHTATTHELAQRFGAVPTAAEVKPQPVRSLEAIAIENAREGCVRECYGAALGWYQARSASDAAIAAAMAQIAEDETSHAALAFAVDAWAHTRLDEDSRARVAAARAEAVALLRCELSLAPNSSACTPLGLPDPCAALRMCSVLEASLWA